MIVKSKNNLIKRGTFFRYKNEKVWDRDSRMDLVFGSTGTTSNILKFMQDLDQSNNTNIDTD